MPFCSFGILLPTAWQIAYKSCLGALSCFFRSWTPQVDTSSNRTVFCNGCQGSWSVCKVVLEFLTGSQCRKLRRFLRADRQIARNPASASVLCRNNIVSSFNNLQHIMLISSLESTVSVVFWFLIPTFEIKHASLCADCCARCDCNISTTRAGKIAAALVQGFLCSWQVWRPRPTEHSAWFHGSKHGFWIKPLFNSLVWQHVGVSTSAWLLKFGGFDFTQIRIVFTIPYIYIYYCIVFNHVSVRKHIQSCIQTDFSIQHTSVVQQFNMSNIYFNSEYISILFVYYE